MEPPLSSCFPGLEIPILRLNAASEFHIYKTIWSPTSVKIYVDDKLFHSVANIIPYLLTKISLIFNVAMGGTFGEQY
jgi:beta-glucanase (GH16 family)